MVGSASNDAYTTFRLLLYVHPKQDKQIDCRVKVRVSNLNLIRSNGAFLGKASL